MDEQKPLERAARALYNRIHPDLEFHNQGVMQQIVWKERAGYVLTELRNIDLQTDNAVEVNMLCAGQAVLPEHDEPMQEDALNCWQAMLDAALNQQGE